MEIRFKKYPETRIALKFYMDHCFQTGMTIERDKSSREWVMRQGYDGKKIKYPDCGGIPPRCVFCSTYNTDI